MRQYDRPTLLSRGTRQAPIVAICIQKVPGMSSGWQPDGAASWCRFSHSAYPRVCLCLSASLGPRGDSWSWLVAGTDGHAIRGESADLTDARTAADEAAADW
jgi:hypothetical protein